jgi:hypothetical protein
MVQTGLYLRRALGELHIPERDGELASGTAVACWDLYCDAQSPIPLIEFAKTRRLTGLNGRIALKIYRALTSSVAASEAI